MTTLVLSSRHTDDAQALWRAAVQRDWPTVRARGITVDAIDDPEIVLYAEALFAPTIAEQLDRVLLDPPEDWLVSLPRRFRKRDIALTTLGAARNMSAPAFVKPPNDKTFTARVFESGRDLPIDYEPDTPVLVAEPVQFTAEYRCFCLGGQVVTASPYSADAHDLVSARAFATEVLADAPATPRAIVIDVGLLARAGWAVVEANGAWGAGIYDCDPNGVLDVIRHATVDRGATGGVEPVS